jgi:hypothetical protein
MGSAKVLEVTVQLKAPASGLDFASRAVAAVQGEARIDAFARFDVVVVSVVWYPDLDRAAELIGAASRDELIWGNPEIVYRYEEVQSAGRRKRLVLEPILLLEVEAPIDFIGNVIGDLMSRRGIMTGQRETDAHTFMVSAELPLAELRGYPAALLEITGSRGVVSATVLRYDERPGYIGPSDEPMSAALRA